MVGDMARPVEMAAVGSILTARDTVAPAAEYVDVSKLKPWANNPRKNDAAVSKVADSIKRFGFGAPLLARLETGEIIAGHTRLKAAMKLKMAQVPVRYLDLSVDEAHALALADNKLGELADWDDDLLAGVLQGLDANGVEIGDLGFDDDELKGLLEDEDVGEVVDAGEIDPGIGPALVKKYGVEIGGSFFVTGKASHVVRCIGATDVSWEDGALLFDPPWDRMHEFSGIAKRASLVFCDGGCVGDAIRLVGAPAWLFVWDCITSWYTPNRPLRRAKLALWYGDVSLYNFDGAHHGPRRDDEPARGVRNTRGSYEFVPDERGKHLSDVFSEGITKVHSDELSIGHTKPIDWVRCLIGCCTAGDVVDPFVGSGTSVIASEQLGRNSFSGDISPEAIAITLERCALSGMSVVSQQRIIV